MAGGMIAAGLALADSKKDDEGINVANNNSGIGIVDDVEKEDISEEVSEEEAKEEEPFTFTDEMYPQYLQGNLTKDELTFVLAAAPSFMNESCYYMPNYLKDENNRIIIESVDPFNGWATYYSVTMMTGQIHEEVIYEGQFPEFGYSSVILLNHLHTKFYSFTNT